MKLIKPLPEQKLLEDFKTGTKSLILTRDLDLKVFFVMHDNKKFGYGVIGEFEFTESKHQILRALTNVFRIGNNGFEFFLDTNKLIMFFTSDGRLNFHTMCPLPKSDKSLRHWTAGSDIAVTIGRARHLLSSELSRLKKI